MPSFQLRDVCVAALVPAVIFVHLLVAPFTKVEETFNIQATHDVLTYGIPKNYDIIAQRYEHALYPGPVPRSFVGPVVLAAAASPLDPYLHGVQRQLLVRGILGLYNASGILYFRSMVKRVYGPTAALWFTLFSVTQFHVMFWASRTLPNFFVYGGCAMALGELLPFLARSAPRELRTVWRVRRSLALLTILGVVFRSEIAVLLGAHVVILLALRRASLIEVLKSGIVGAIIGLLLTVPLDSYLYDKYPEWPELTSFIFNVVEGKSSDWGVSPIHYYFTSALPRLLLNPVMLIIGIPLALSRSALRSSALQLLSPNLMFIAVYSLLPHKERRFIIYILPSVTTVAALGAGWIWNRRFRSILYRLGSAILMASVGIAFAGNMIMLGISAANYPGAHAIYALHEVARPTKSPLHVHMDTLSIMTGATRFMELGAEPHSEYMKQHDLYSSRWIYDKTEQQDKSGNLTFWNSFDYALAELPERLAGDWKIIATVEGFDGIQILRRGEEARRWGTSQLAELYDRVSQMMRRRLTAGWWVQIRMRPLIHVLQNQQRAA